MSSKNILKRRCVPTTNIQDSGSSSHQNQNVVQDSLFESFMKTQDNREPFQMENLCIDQQLNSLCYGNRLHSETNILEYWVSKKYDFPELFSLASVVLSLPTTQVSVERCFSGLALVLTNHRARLSGTTLEKILLLKLNKNILNELSFNY